MPSLTIGVSMTVLSKNSYTVANAAMWLAMLLSMYLSIDMKQRSVFAAQSLLHYVECIAWLFSTNVFILCLFSLYEGSWGTQALCTFYHSWWVFRNNLSATWRNRRIPAIKTLIEFMSLASYQKPIRKKGLFLSSLKREPENVFVLEWQIT